MPELNLGKVVGPQGPQGAVGPAGAQGIQGPQGVPGEAGKSAYQAARDGGYTGTESEFNAIMAIIDKHASRHKTGGADPLTAADVGAAPAGYGLGSAISPFPKGVNDWNKALENGFYRASVNSPLDRWGWGPTFCYAEGRGMQMIFTAENSSRPIGVAYRAFKDGAFEEWEWENPPMELGKEYRTTQRYMGKPVYVKAVSTGAMPAATGLTNRIVLDFGVAGVTAVVHTEVEVTTSDGQFPGTLPYFDNGLIVLLSGYPRVSGNNIYYYIEAAKDMSAYSGTAIAWYTKN